MSVRKCEPGKRLAKTIYNEKGTVLLNANVELSQSLLKRLISMGIDQIYVQDKHTEDVVIEDPISDETRIRATKEIRTNFRKMMDENISGKRVSSNHFIGKDFRNIMTLILDDLNDHKNAMMMLSTINVTDLYLFQHSLNVCIYTTMLGMAHGYTRDELTVLGMGAMLHDIGKTKIPLDILKKPGKLTDDEFIAVQEHTTLGYKMLKDEPNIPLLTAHCAFQHHERIDGSGYPRHIKGDEIHDYAKWIGLVDAYDAMTSNRVYRDAMLPHQAIEILYTGADVLFDKKMLERFRDKFALYPLGVTVQLHSGETGVVVDINSSAPQRPIVRIIEDAEGQELKQTYEIDLSKKLNIMIVSVNDVKVSGG